MAKKINHRGRGGHRELLFSLCPLCSLWFSDPIPEDNKKSPNCSPRRVNKKHIFFHNYLPHRVVLSFSKFLNPSIMVFPRSIHPMVLPSYSQPALNNFLMPHLYRPDYPYASQRNPQQHSNNVIVVEMVCVKCGCDTNRYSKNPYDHRPLRRSFVHSAHHILISFYINKILVAHHHCP